MSTLIVLGLGNPGSRYQPTRHNVGFRVLDRLAERRELPFRVEGAADLASWTEETPLGARLVVLAKPRTYMNRSGEAALELRERHGAAALDLLAVYDDADLELGRLRLRSCGGSGGHNGVKSLIEALGTECFPRVRLGVRGATRGERELADYVLSRFEPDEEPIAAALVSRGAEAVEAALRLGLEAAMNRYNTHPPAADPS